MTVRWYCGRFVISFPRMHVLRGPIFAFALLFMVVTVLICSPRMSPGLILPTQIEYVTPSQPLISPKSIYSDDYHRLIDLTEFDFLFNHFPCNKSVTGGQTAPSLVLLIFVHSHPANLAKRQIIRDTWGSWAYIQRADIAINLIFLLGEVLNASLQERIRIENKITNDIVQGRFIDSYRNLTYKHVMGLKWCTYFCPQASYVLKTDDDVFVNTPALVRFLTVPRPDSPIKLAADRFILCNRIDNARVKRSHRSKWYVSPKEYSSNVYPSYCMGCTILYSYDVVKRLYEKAQVAPYFWVDDVHITGILSKQCNLNLTRVDNLMLEQSQVEGIILNPHKESEASWFKFWKKDSLAWGKGKEQFLYATELRPNDIRKLWKIIKDNNFQIT
ncbi:beta-1,3-galactosyltransferase 5 [Hetaerina americana]|uniref:beta-1,3-galactosyltransferase 5 n=1 Tax=Hetaerina americana TaxID=62018 RepID=UPI003A7F4B2C